MVRTFAYALRALPDLAFRQVVGIVVLLCLVFGPLGSAMATHHVDDADMAIAMSAGTPNPDAAKSASDHGSSLPNIDHDCHGCAIAVVPVPTDVFLARVASERDLTSEPLVIGQAPSAELRPPRA